MSEVKHTPGPWVKGRHGQCYGSNGKQVAVWDSGIAWSSRDDETEANARLIASAPDLLEALREMLAEKESYMRLNNLGDPMKESVSNLARASIAKAKGQTQ